MTAALRLSLYAGQFSPAPAPATIMSALRSVEVNTSDTGNTGFQITFQAARTQSSGEYDVIASGVLDPWHRVVLVAWLDGSPVVLSDGLITHTQLVRGSAGAPDTFVVSGKDVSVAMDRMEKSIPWPVIIDSLTVMAVCATYLNYGVIPIAWPTMATSATVPLEQTTQQVETDLAFMQRLATRNGYVFMVMPAQYPLSNPASNTFSNYAWFGPPNWAQLQPNFASQSALAVDRVPGANTLSVQFTYDAIGPTFVSGSVQDDEVTGTDVPVVTVASTRIALSSMPTLYGNVAAGQGAVKLLDARGMDTIEAYLAAQAITDQSTDQVATVNGELDVLDYGHILTAPGSVTISGAGSRHDGAYYIKAVTHSITPQSYKQSFTLVREGQNQTLSLSGTASGIASEAIGSAATSVAAGLVGSLL